jgi:uncharacterized protein YuzE
MRISIDREADAMLLVLQDGPWVGTRPVAPDVNLEIGQDGQVMAIEVLNVSHHISGEAPEHLELSLDPAMAAEDVAVD